MLFDKSSIKTKYGFSLFEVVVTMSIIAVFIAAASNIFTQKFQRKLALPAHGRFECYYDNNGKLHEKQVSENAVVKDEEVTADEDGKYYCTFNPVKSSAYLVINAVGGGGAGGDVTGGSAGTYKSIFLPTTTHKLRIVPGRGSKYGAAELSDDKKATFVYDLDSAGAGTTGRIVVMLSGGKTDSGDINNALISYCNVSLAKFICTRSASCGFDNKARVLNVDYCKANGEDIANEAKDTLSFSDILTKAISDGVELDKYQVITHNKYTEEYAGIDHPNVKEEVVYSLAILFDGNFTANKQVSGFNDYIEALEINDGVASLTCLPGDGGAAQGDGCDGAVVLAW